MAQEIRSKPTREQFPCGQMNRTKILQSALWHIFIYVYIHSSGNTTKETPSTAYLSWMRDTNGELHPLTRIGISFRQAICAYYTHNSKTTGPMRTFCISNDSSTIQRHSFVWARVTWKIPTGELRPQARIDRCLIQTCVRILQARIHDSDVYVTNRYVTLTRCKTGHPL